MSETVKINFQGKTFDSGWPLSPVYPCVKDVLGLPKGEVICHLALSPVVACAYEPRDCPFFGRYPTKENNR